MLIQLDEKKYLNNVYIKKEILKFFVLHVYRQINLNYKKRMLKMHS